MKIYKLVFQFKSLIIQDYLDCTIEGIVPSQVREAFYVELKNNGIDSKSALKIWNDVKTKMVELDLEFPNVTTISAI